MRTLKEQREHIMNGIMSDIPARIIKYMLMNSLIKERMY